MWSQRDKLINVTDLGHFMQMVALGRWQGPTLFWAWWCHYDMENGVNKTCGFFWNSHAVFRNSARNSSTKQTVEWYHSRSLTPPTPTPTPHASKPTEPPQRKSAPLRLPFLPMWSGNLFKCSVAESPATDSDRDEEWKGRARVYVPWENCENVGEFMWGWKQTSYTPCL